MNEKIKSAVTTVKTKWTDASKMAKILIISIPIVVIAIIIVLCIILNNTGKNTAVLFSGLSNSEAGEIASAIQALDGAPEVTVNAKGDVIVPAERADSIRMQMWAQGYPKSTTNYDIWDNGVDLWSTDMDKREIKRQQLETRLGSTISSMDKIQAATVNLTLPETSNYVISTEKGDSQCAVFLQLRSDAEPLTNAEVRAIYRGVTTSVEGLTNENVSVMDSKMNSYEWVDPELDNVDDDEDKSGVDVARKRLEFEREFVQVLKDGLGEMFTKMYGENGFAFNVSARLNYDAKDVESTQYQPADGTNAGVINHQDQVNEGGKLDEDGGVVVETDIRSVGTSDLLGRSNYDCLRYSTLLDIARRRSALDSHYDFIADRRVATLRAAKHTDTKHFLCTAVISYCESTFLLYHNYFALSMICTNLQRFVLLNGRVSMIRTVSPSLQVSSRHSATNFVVLFTNLP